MDSKQNGQVGSLRWIATVNAIWKEFGQEHFFAWKACMLDKSHHWLDCVEADESIPSSSLTTEPLAGQPPRAHFQMSWLQLISIFTADQSYYLYAPNQKGHSRLHDICTELFLTVCHDCLCDADLSETQKAFIQPLLRKQINQHVTLLSQQIAKTPLAQQLNHWQNRGGDLQELSDHLSSPLKSSIPPRLQYLVRSLETMITLPEQEKVCDAKAIGYYA